MMKKIGNWKEWLINYAKRTPYSHIGTYMQRWWIVPYRHECALKWYRNPFGWLLQQFDIAIRIHEIHKSDNARAVHDHPWYYITVILKGGYVEITSERQADGTYLENRKMYTAGDILFRKAEYRHRLEMIDYDLHTWLEHGEPEVTTTLFITFKKTNDWGFFPKPNKFIPYKKYLEKHEQ